MIETCLKVIRALATALGERHRQLRIIRTMGAVRWGCFLLGYGTATLTHAVGVHP